MNNENQFWQPRTYEDKLLYNYHLEFKGSLFLEVPIGNAKGIWPKGSKIRRIDGIRILDGNNKIYSPFDLELFKKLVQDNNIELIEVKRKLNRLVYGQVIAGMDMFKKQYKTQSTKGVILCEIGDPAMELICEEREIEVVIL